ncbi:MAG: polysaccharide deacetylase family protein [Propionibacteriales bacterium]|nr:polysaccharide deacetylase family protein [Propionibacteriales bacterium]
MVIDPGLAFTSDRLGQGFADYFVTAQEFRRILHQLWRNGWTLVDVHRAAAGTVRVPVGRKPLVLSEDDVNYYRYFAGRGLASRLVVNGTGKVRAACDDDLGTRLTDDDVVPLVEQAVARHPEFSADGAKGVLALTGYEGLPGGHGVGRSPRARARVRVLADQLRRDGWTFASHTYGHIDLTRTSTSAIARDTRRWRRLAEPLLGRVDVLVYPFGARPTQDGVRLLRRAGSPQLHIDIRRPWAIALAVSRMRTRIAIAAGLALNPLLFGLVVGADPECWVGSFCF